MSVDRLPVRRVLSCGVVLGALLVSGCGSSRSPEAFCAAIDKHKERFLSAMSSAQKSLDSGTTDGFIGGAVQGAAALGDLQRMWEDLADVAPEDIQHDAEAVRDGYAKQYEAAEKMASGDVVSALTGTLMNGVVMIGPLQRIDTFTKEHCSGA